MSPRGTGFAAGGGAVVRRELRAVVLHRLGQAGAALALAGGGATALVAEEPGAATGLLLQLALYLVPLFAVLAGVSSARAEAEEWPMLLAQPLARGRIVFGKFLALGALLAVVLALLFLPALVAGEPPGPLLGLAARSLGLAAVAGSLGLWAGLASRDRVQGLVLAVCAWLGLLLGLDFAAMLAVQWPAWQRWPELWVGALMLNPFEAFRIQALFALEQIPPEAAARTPLALWWTQHAGLWLAGVLLAWTAALLALARRQLERTEV